MALYKTTAPPPAVDLKETLYRQIPAGYVYLGRQPLRRALPQAMVLAAITLCIVLALWTKKPEPVVDLTCLQPTKTVVLTDQDRLPVLWQPNRVVTVIPQDRIGN
jgi:hypothetical protein